MTIHIVAESMAGDRVSTAPNRHKSVAFAGEANDRDYIGGAAAAGDQRWPAVDVSVPDLPGALIGGVAGLDQLTQEVSSEILDVDCVQGSRHGSEPRRG
jgi:hypothetical protein